MKFLQKKLKWKTKLKFAEKNGYQSLMITKISFKSNQRTAAVAQIAENIVNK